MEVVRPNIVFEGPIAFHDYACPVYHESGQAVFHCNKGIFYPSWRAQKEGWHLIRAKTWLQKIIFKLLFKDAP